MSNMEDEMKESQRNIWKPTSEEQTDANLGHDEAWEDRMLDNAIHNMQPNNVQHISDPDYGTMGFICTSLVTSKPEDCDCAQYKGNNVSTDKPLKRKVRTDTIEHHAFDSGFNAALDTTTGIVSEPKKIEPLEYDNHPPSQDSEYFDEVLAAKLNEIIDWINNHA